VSLCSGLATVLLSLFENVLIVVLILSGSSMWGGVTISYKIKLTHQGLVVKYDAALHSRVKHQQQELCSRKDRLVALQAAWTPIQQLVASLQSDVAASLRHSELHCRSSRAALCVRVDREGSRREMLRGVRAAAAGRVRDGGEAVQDLVQSALARSRQVVLGGQRRHPRLVRTTAAAAAAGTSSRGVAADGIEELVVEAHCSSSSPSTSPSPSSLASKAGAAAVFSCAGLHIRAGSDFRLPVCLSQLARPVTLTYSFSLPKLLTQPKHVIGFAILAREEDGSLPQLLPYRFGVVTCCDGSGKRVVILLIDLSPGCVVLVVLVVLLVVFVGCRKVPSTGLTGSVEIDDDVSGDLVVLFDNTFSWLHAKDVQ
jgi:hypothetical protein